MELNWSDSIWRMEGVLTERLCRRNGVASGRKILGKAEELWRCPSYNVLNKLSQERTRGFFYSGKKIFQEKILVIKTLMAQRLSLLKVADSSQNPSCPPPPGDKDSEDLCWDKSWIRIWTVFPSPRKWPLGILTRPRVPFEEACRLGTLYRLLSALSLPTLFSS